jgi:hypothetical protein
MQGHVHEVLRAWIRPEQAEVQHVRDPGERMPIGIEEGGEGPSNVVGREARLHPRILVYVLIVVVSYVTVGGSLRIDSQNRQRQQDADEDRERPR